MMADPTRANPSTQAYERARKVVLGWLASLHPEVASVIPGDDGRRLIDSLIQGEAFNICDHHRGSSQLKQVYVKKFLGAMINLRLYEG